MQAETYDEEEVDGMREGEGKVDEGGRGWKGWRYGRQDS